MLAAALLLAYGSFAIAGHRQPLGLSPWRILFPDPRFPDR